MKRKLDKPTAAQTQPETTGETTGNILAKEIASLATPPVGDNLDALLSSAQEFKVMNTEVAKVTESETKKRQEKIRRLIDEAMELYPQLLEARKPVDVSFRLAADPTLLQMKEETRERLETYFANLERELPGIQQVLMDRIAEADKEEFIRSEKAKMNEAKDSSEFFASKCVKAGYLKLTEEEATKGVDIVRVNLYQRLPVAINPKTKKPYFIAPIKMEAMKQEGLTLRSDREEPFQKDVFLTLVDPTGTKVDLRLQRTALAILRRKLSEEFEARKSKDNSKK